MVCIDEVVAYFKTLKSYERLWMMCRLQSHCLPIELRYLGTCLDNLSKRDIHILKKLELEANDPASVSEVTCKCICDKTVRAAVIKYLSVLNTNSTKCSQLIYKVLTDEKGLERIFKCPKVFFNDKNAFEELMVLYTLAINHPAFSFEQKTQLNSIFNCIKKEKERQLSKNKGGDQDKESSDSLETINTMIPPPNYMYQQAHGGPNLPLNRNGYLYPRHYYPFPPINVPPMQVCYDYPPPSVVSTVRGPHQANFSKSSSPVSWPPRTFQINPRNQPPNTNLKQRHTTPPRYRNQPDPSYPYAQSWNNWNMYQMSPHNMYPNYNYTHGMVPSFYPEGSMGRSYQGYGTKSKYSTVHRSQDQYKSQVPVSLSTTTSNKIDTAVKSTKPVITNTTIKSSSENEAMRETQNQMPSSSKSVDACNDSSTYKATNLPALDQVSVGPSQPAVHNNSTRSSPKTDQSASQSQNCGPKAINTKFTSENKAKPDSGVQIIPKHQTALLKTCSPPLNSQQTISTDIKPPATTVKEAPKNETTKTIDLSSLSAVLDDGKNKEEKSTVVLNDVTDEKSKINSDHKPQNSKIMVQQESSTTEGYEIKDSTAGTTAKPINTPVTTTAYNSQASKYYKGRPIQSQPRPRDGNLNNSYNRKPVAGLVVSSYNETMRENAHKSHPKVPNNGQQYYTMSYDNGASARAYNTQTYYVHQPQTSQPMPGYSPIPRPYIPQQHVVQSPEYQQVYQQPTEFVYYPSSPQAFYTTPTVLMQPQVLTYHPPKVSCYNCGGQNHTGAECTELTMEEITNKGLYENHYGPSMPDGRPRN